MVPHAAFPSQLFIDQLTIRLDIFPVPWLSVPSILAIRFFVYPPSGKLTSLLKMAIEIVGLPIRNDDLP